MGPMNTCYKIKKAHEMTTSEKENFMNLQLKTRRTPHWTPRRTRAALLAASITGFVALSTACSSGFDSGSAAAPPAGTNTGASTGDGSTDAPGWSAIDLNGSINGGRFDRTKAVEI